MATVTVPNAAPSNEFTVINGTTVSYLGTLYEGVTSIDYPDGTSKTCAQIIAEAGGDVYSTDELKSCVRVEGYDPDQNNRQVFTVYSTNSRQTAKNEVQQVAGGMWIEVVNFLGTPANNPTLALMQQYGQGWNPAWLGFTMNYGHNELRSYVMTQSNPFGEESIPCPPVQIQTTLMHDAKLSGVFKSLPVIAGQRYIRPNLFKLYRSRVASDGSAAYNRVDVPALSQAPGFIGPFPYTVPNSVSELDTSMHGFYFLDNKLAEDLLEELPSLDWDAPPLGLKGLTAWRNGMATAFDGTNLYICEPFKPFTFPQKYRQAIPRKILATRVDGNALIVITDGEPYIFTGSHPSNVSYESIDNGRAGLIPASVMATTPYMPASRAVVSTPIGVIYATREGLELIRGGQPARFGRGLWTREEWSLRWGSLISQLRLAYSDGRLLGYVGNGSAGVLMSIVDEQPQLCDYDPDNTYLRGDYTSPADDALYLLHGATFSDSVTILTRFVDEHTSGLSFVYHTRDEMAPRPLNFGALQVRGAGSNVAITVFVYADQALHFTEQFVLIPGDVSRAYNFRMPSGVKAVRWSVYLQANGGTAIVREVHLAETMLDLMRV